MPRQHGPPVASRVRLPRAETTVAPPRLPGLLRVDLVEIIENGPDRGAQAVDVEAAELGPLVLRPLPVVLAHPVDEVVDLLVAPHPGGETLEGSVIAIGNMAVAHIGIDARCIRPVRLDGDDGKAVLFDQALRDRGTGTIKFRRTVGGFAEEHHLGVCKAVEHGAEGLFIGNRRQSFPMLAHEIDRLLDGGVVLVLLPRQSRHDIRSARPALCKPAQPENDGGLGLFQGMNGAGCGKPDGREVLRLPSRETYPGFSSEASALHGAAKINRSRTDRYATLAMMDA